jgi:hypothetical protein
MFALMAKVVEIYQETISSLMGVTQIAGRGLFLMGGVTADKSTGNWATNHLCRYTIPAPLACS